jgi:hypothetical protein
MNCFRQKAILATAALLVATSSLRAQKTSPPHIGYVYPAGGEQNTSFEVIVGGQHLKETNEIYISGGGVNTEVVKHYRPLTQGEYNQLNMKIRDAREKLGASSGNVSPEVLAKAAGITDEQLKEMEIYRKRQADPKRQPNNQIIEEITLKITIDANAEKGKRELRLITPAGMSNPVWFIVGQWPERMETEPNDDNPDPVVGSTLPVVINGQIMPGDVDRFSFTARQGTRLVITSDVRELMPYLADAVPGWFQAVLVLYDSDGNELAYAGAYHYRQDPVIYYEVPEDGQYFVEIRDSIYRGREDFTYRITMGELPFVTGIFPLGGIAGKETTVNLEGWNLVETQLKVRVIPNRNRPVRWFEIPQTDRVSIRFPLRIDMMGEVQDEEPNDTPETAQEVKLPIIVNGRISKPDDKDVFRFSATGKLVAEVFARRAGSPVDSSLTLTDADGKMVGYDDDYTDKAQPLITHHADSRLSIPLPGNGPYCLTMTDARRKGGEDFIYRLYIRHPRPDFDLRVYPSSIIARPGAHVPINAHAIRRDGFNDDIALTLVEPPAGFHVSGATIPEGADNVQMTLTVPPTAVEEPVVLEMDGHSLGSRRHRRFTRPAVPAENMMQAFIWYQLVPAEQWTVVVKGKPVNKLPFEFPPADRVKLKLGEETKVGARVTGKYPPAKELRAELNEPPKGISVKLTSAEPPGLLVVVATDAETVKVGQRGNLVFEAVREWTPAATEEIPNPKARRTSYGFLPAIPFEVVK